MTRFRIKRNKIHPRGEKIRVFRKKSVTIAGLDFGKMPDLFMSFS